MKMDIDKILGKEQNGSSNAQDSMKIDKSELRKRDPIGQLLDSLCNSSKEKEQKENTNQVDKALDDASAFTPFSKPRQIHSSGPKSVCSDDFHTGNDVTSWTMPMSHTYFHGYRHFYNPLDTSMLSPKNHSTVSSPGMHYPIPSSMVNHPTPYQIAYPGTRHSQNFSSFQHFAGTLPYFASRYLQTGLETFAQGQKQPNSQNFDIFEKKEKAQYVSVAPRYQCEDCKKSYSTYGGLTKHKQFHCSTQQKKEFVCKFCGKSYGSLGALKMHIRTHTLPCKCKICGKAFSRPWLLQGHMRTHTGEKPFSCLHCARAFADRSNLRAHLQTHSDVKKYACKSCSKTFSRMSLLIKHRENNNCV